MGTEEEIARRLQQGATPLDLLSDGFAKSTVYKVRGNGRRRQAGLPDFLSEREKELLTRAAQKAYGSAQLTAQLEAQIQELQRQHGRARDGQHLALGGYRELLEALLRLHDQDPAGWAETYDPGSGAIRLEALAAGRPDG